MFTGLRNPDNSRARLVEKGFHLGCYKLAFQQEGRHVNLSAQPH